MSKIYIAIKVDEEGSIKSSYAFKEATMGQLSMVNHELDILKQIIIEHLRASRKSYDFNGKVKGE